ncbi:type VII secretion system-associated protein [Streptomyces sp. NPDC054765]
MSETSGEARAASDPAEPAPDGGTATATVDPAPPEEFIEAAKLAPDHWLYLIDPTWSDEGPPPEWAVVGQWRSDSEGEIVEWQDNEDYRPSPSAMGWPDPADDVDAAIQLATTGYGPADDVTKALAKAEVAVLVTADGDPVLAAAPDSTPVVLVYSSPKYLHLAGRLAFETVKVPEFLDRIPQGHSLCINSSGPVSMVMTTDGLADIMKAAEEAPEGDGEQSGSAAGSVWPPTMSTAVPEQEAPGQEANEPEANGSADGSANGVVKGAAKRGRSRAASANASSRVEDVPLPEPEQQSAPEPGAESGSDSDSAS